MRGANRRHVADRRQRERRSRLAAIQANHDDLIETVARNAEEIKKLEAEQQIQLTRIAQIQLDIDNFEEIAIALPRLLLLVTSRYGLVTILGRCGLVPVAGP